MARHANAAAAETIEARQAVIDAARENLAQMEAEQATKLHADLAAFNGRIDATYADLRDQQAKLDAEHRITAKRQAEEAAQNRADYFAGQEQEAIANLTRYLECIEAAERGADLHMRARKAAAGHLDAIRENIRILAPNGSTAGTDRRSYLMRITERLCSMMRLNPNEGGSWFFGRLNVATLGQSFIGRETGWREQEERILAAVIDECITARRQHEAQN